MVMCVLCALHKPCSICRSGYARHETIVLVTVPYPQRLLCHGPALQRWQLEAVVPQWVLRLWVAARTRESLPSAINGIMDTWGGHARRPEGLPAARQFRERRGPSHAHDALGIERQVDVLLERWDAEHVVLRQHNR